MLVGHDGNARHLTAGEAIHCPADRLRTSAAASAEIHSAFLVQPPVVEHWPDLTGLPSVLVVPCFLGSGGHVREDLPQRLRMTVAGGREVARKIANFQWVALCHWQRSW